MRRPAIDRRSLGVGLDMPWAGAIGFTMDEEGREGPTERVRRFFADEGDRFSHVFLSWQPKHRGRLRAEDYFEAFDAFFEHIEGHSARALHQTAFNLGALEPYDRAAIVDLSNGLIERHDLRWVNEDLGLWASRGRPLPYPLPPFLNDEGLRAAIRNAGEVQRTLAAPLVIEFPGFSEDLSLPIGDWHAYDFFRHVIEESGSMATLDVGHLLSYQWMRGRRGADLYADLERLPLTSCFEIHLSGCSIAGDRFLDLHHGVLLDEQLELFAQLLPLCPNLGAVTYEDPRPEEDGRLSAAALAGLARLEEETAAWAA